MDIALSPPVGQLLGGRYHVDARIARGGMATVYLSTDTRLDRVVALKIAHPGLSDDAEFVRRFIGEARSAARLSSPNVVAIFDQGSDKRLHYIAMEYVPGRTLRQLLNERGRLSVREALDIMAGVLAGLAAAHEAGLAHRDVKPENVLLTTSGVPKVADFGLARSVAGAVQTKGGMIIGTAAYLAPEQVSGGTSDARTDVYAAGIMLFELLTGIQPHTAESPLDVAYKHVNEVVPAPSGILPGLSSAVDALVAMATSRDPDLRPANAGQFLRAIQEVRDGRALAGTAHYQAHASYDPAIEPYPGLNRPSAHSGPQLDPRASGDSGPVPGRPEFDGSGPLWVPAPAAGSRPYQAQGPEGGSAPYGPGFRGAGSYDDGAGSYSGPLRNDSAPFWDATPRVVGASALPSLSPQGPDGPSAGDQHPVTNSTLVVADAGQIAQYGDLQPAHFAPPSGERRYRRRRAAERHEPLLSRYLFSSRLIYITGALAVILVIALLAWWFSSGRYQNVPGLRGLSLTAAKNILKNEGLSYKLAHPRHNPLPKGDVIKVSPGNGQRVASGSSVTLTLSLGPVVRTVPNVSGQPEAAARTFLVEHHLRVGQDKQETSSTVQAGYVIGTIPRAFSNIPQNQPVRLIVSVGPGLPDFVGMQVTDAETAASSGGYTINPVPDAKGSQPANTITSQSPAPGTPITSGEVVTVHFSPGPPTIPVPNVQGMPVAQAIATMHEAGFRIAVNHAGPGQTVGNYSPQGNQPKGTVITLTIGIFGGL
jgi:serine/threonine protein kinase/beta-lactam-binding protein with PASTA domain